MLSARKTTLQAGAVARYALDSKQSLLRIYVYRAGLLGFLGHDHLITATAIDGELSYTPPPAPAATFKLVLPVAALLAGSEAGRRRRELKRKTGASLAYATVLQAILKDYFASAFYFTYHLVRYYLVLMLLAAIFIPAAAPLLVGLILFPALVEFARKQPRLSLPLFLFFYLAEQAFYQAGVFWGCLIWNSFRPYHLWFFRYQPGLTGKN